MRVVVSHLRSLNIQHRFILAGNKQQLILLRREDCNAVEQVITQWQSGNLDKTGSNDLSFNFNSKSKSIIRRAHKPAPLTLLLIFFGFVGAALVGFGWQFIHPFTFWDSSQALYLPFVDFNPWADIQNGQLWRLITPVFLHFGPVHIIFNALWIWYLGAILEFNQGRVVTLVLVLVIGIISNSAQAFVSEGIIFGGLSGIVHGLFAYCWLWGKLNKSSSVQIPDALFIVITLLMLLSTLEIFDIIVGSEIADTAHVSGYITGFLCALGAYFLNSHSLTNER